MRNSIKNIMVHIKKCAKQFKEDCKKSKENAIRDITLLVLGVMLTAAVLYGLFYVSRYLLVGLILLIIFVPGLDKWLENKLSGYSAQINTYPVYVGSNGMRVLPHLVSDAFVNFDKYFSVCYLDNFWENTTHVFYRFQYREKPGMPVSYDLLMILQKEAEKVLSSHLREFGLFLPCEDMTVVDIQSGYLIVAYAKDAAGIQETIHHQEVIRRKYHDPHDKPPGVAMQENWNEDER